MPRTYDKDADNTVVVIRTGATRIKAVLVRQRTFDAPVLFLKLFDDATVTMNAQAADFSIRVPAGRAGVDAQTAKIIFAGNEGGLIFATALTYGVSKLNTVSDTTPDAGDEPEVIIDWEPLG
jgi:hypothetical protein